MKTLPLTLVEVVKVAPWDRFRMTEVGAHDYCLSLTVSRGEA